MAGSYQHCVTGDGKLRGPMMLRAEQQDVTP